MIEMPTQSGHMPTDVPTETPTQVPTETGHFLTHMMNSPLGSDTLMAFFTSTEF